MSESNCIDDPEQMKVLFQQQLPGYAQGLYVITQCQILRIQHRPYLSAGPHRADCITIRYQLKVIDRRSQKEEVQMLFAKVYPKGCGQGEFQKLRTDFLSPPRFGDALVYISDLDMIVWAFPNDPGMVHLPEIMDPHKLKSYLPYDHLPRGVDKPEDVTDMELDVVRYHPEIRCTFRLSFKCKLTKEPLRTHILYGKTFNDEQGKDLYRVIRHLWLMSIKEQDCFIIAQPLDYNDTMGILWQKALSGKSLTGIIDGTNCEDFLTSVAKGLAHLHKGDLAHFIQQGTFDQPEKILDKIGKAMKELPQLEKNLGLIVFDIKKKMSCLTPVTNRPVHGSFRIKEVLICEKGTAVFDLDKVSMGDWVRDLALFLVDLHLFYSDTDMVRLMSSSFFNAYCSQVDWEVPADRLQWHIQVQYLKRIIWIYKNKRLDNRLVKRIQKVITLIQKGIDFDPKPN